MPTNDIATYHILTATDAMFFKIKLSEINERIKRILDENGLKGHWTLSEDLKWLIKTGE